MVLKAVSQILQFDTLKLSENIICSFPKVRWPLTFKLRAQKDYICLRKKTLWNNFLKHGGTYLPVSIFPSCAAGPSGITLFTCRNSSGSSPPMMVNPKPMLLFLRVVLRNVPFNWDASRVKSGFSTLANIS